MAQFTQIKGDHYQFEDPFLYVLSTDSHIAPKIPSAEYEGHILLPGPKGDKRANRSKTFWLEKLGTSLGHDFIGIGLGAESGVVKSSGSFGRKHHQRKFILYNFPVNYSFYLKRRSDPDTKTVGRYDACLTGGDKTFYSPNEFICHLAWIMSGMPSENGKPLCSCKLCSHTNQKRINAFIKEKLRIQYMRLQQKLEEGKVISRAPKALNRPAFLNQRRRASYEIQKAKDSNKEGRQRAERQSEGRNSTASLDTCQHEDRMELASEGERSHENAMHITSSDLEKEMEVDEGKAERKVEEEEKKRKRRRIKLQKRENDLMLLHKEIKHTHSTFFDGLECPQHY